MATITATTNQQYYHGYPVVPGNLSSVANPNAQAVAYHHNNQHQQHHHHQSQAYAAATSHHHMMTQQQQHHEMQTYQQQHHLNNNHHHHHHLQHQQSDQVSAPIGATSLTTSATLPSTTLTTSTGSEFGLDDAKSTKKASKQRRDAINKEIAVLRDLIPLPDSTRQRLSQLQLMALVLVYVRKSNYFCNGK